MILKNAGAMGVGARDLGRMTLGEIALMLRGWRIANCPPEGPKPPSDDDWDAAMAADR